MHLAQVLFPLCGEGCAVTNVIRNLASHHDGQSTVVTSHNRPVEIVGSNNVRVNYMGIIPNGYFDRTEMFVDHAFGLTGRERPFTGRDCVPAMDALSAMSPDVIILHTGSFTPSTIPNWRRRFPDCGLFLYMHSHLPRSYTAKELRKLFQPLDGIIGVSEYIQNYARMRMGKAPSHLTFGTVLNGVDTGKFHPPEFAPEASNVLFTGQVKPHKGVDIAVKTATSTRHPIQLTIVGSSTNASSSELSPYEKQLRKIAAKAGRRGSGVQFQPFFPHNMLPEVYKKAGIMLIPSRFDDPCPLVCLEAMASGAAVIASNKGGLPSICGSAALNVEPKVSAFTKAIDHLINNPVEYQDLRRKARERALSLTWAHSYKQLMTIITRK